ncbi:MAG: threonylcarbamoyl-AMP synthase [Verrucomicrobia bacterium]|nr:threonylcarbamoyl-AMP synthase [Verrucomicrobiota bacterium]
MRIPSQARILSLSRRGATALDAARETICAGGVVLFPTESVYGLGVDSGQSAAIARLYAIKGRPRDKPFQWLTSDVAVARAASGGWNERAEKLARAFWPGPLTLVVPSKGGAIGWRVPKHKWLLALLQTLPRPLVATSANLAGAAAPRTFQEALRPFRRTIDLALDGGATKEGVASTVVELKAGRIRILRPGAIPEESLMRVVAGGKP